MNCAATPPEESDPPQTVPTKTRWGWALAVAKWAIVLLVLWAIRRTLLQAWHQLGEVEWAFRPGWLLAAAAFYAVGLLPAGIYWFVLLRRLGHPVNLPLACAAYVVGGLGKYVPGKAMVVVIRSSMVYGPGVQPLLTAGSVILETLTMMSVGAFWAACLVGWQVAQGQMPTELLWVCLGLFAVTTLPTLPAVARPMLRLAQKLGRVILRQPDVWLSQVRLSTLGLGWLLMSFLWASWGFSFLATLAATGQVDVRWGEDLGPAVAAVAFGTVAGFVVVIIPGGLGVREAALAEISVLLLTHRTPHPELMAVTAAALLRVIWILTELILAGIFMMMGRTFRPHEGGD